MPYCCENCFSHEWLKQRVKEMTVLLGACDYCEADCEPEEEEGQPQEVALVEVDELAEYFHRLLSMYSVPEYDIWEMGEPLIWRVQWDWGVFDEDRLSEDQQVRLLEDIVNSDWDDDDGEFPVDARDFYMRGRMLHTTHAETWAEFVSAVRENPDKDIPLSYELDESLERGHAEIPDRTTFYRARLSCEVGRYGEYEPYREAAIGAPPPECRKSGRANREEDSVLYCADDELTAIAEMRPPRGYLVSVCSLTLNRPARILDLCAPMKPVNPFITETPLWECELNDLLGAFAEEMSHPLERDNQGATHYLPTQKLAEYIRDEGFDGVRYPSALNEDGANVVFFDPGIATIGESRLVRVTKTHVEYEREETGREREQRMMEQFQTRERVTIPERKGHNTETQE